MRAVTKEGRVIVLKVGQQAIGLSLLTVTLDADDVRHSEFQDWFDNVVAPRLEPVTPYLPWRVE